MKKSFILFFVFCFSTEAQNNWFSPQLTTRDKIELTRRISEQVNRSPDFSYSPPKPLASPTDYENIKMILDLPLANRTYALAHYGPNSFSILKQFVFSKKQRLSVRWGSLIGLARVYPERSLSIIKKSLNSSEWFLKNAGLIAMEIVDSKEAVRWAGELLDDPSLVVRTAAVNMIKKHKASQYKFQLLSKLNAPDSFYKNKSLWIRHHIVATLADFSKPGEEKMFVSLLQDSDSRLHSPAMKALEKLTGKTFRLSFNQNESDTSQALAADEQESQRQSWISWWSLQQSG